MSYSANQYNYATPLSSVASLTKEQSAVVDKKYFSLSDNVLDGSYYPISGDVGLWSSNVSDSNGVLPTPFVVTVDEVLTINAFRLTGSIYSYPVAFTVKFYNGASLLYTITETANNQVEYVHYLPSTLNATKYEISVTKISHGNTAARLYNVYNPMYVKRTDTARIRTSHVTSAPELVHLNRRDTLRVSCTPGLSGVTNSIGNAKDTIKVTCSGTGTLTNVHTRMKEPSRRVYGKVYVTYTDPMLDTTTNIVTSNTAYNSVPEQVLDGVISTNRYFFNLYDNDLSGRYVVSDHNSQVGWVSGSLSNASGTFDGQAPYIRVDFTTRLVSTVRIVFDNSRGAIPVDFTVTYHRGDSSTVVRTFTGNTESVVTIAGPVTNVVAVTVTVTKISKAGYPVVILDMPVMSTLEYVGYEDISNLVNIDLLEELTYDDEVEALGGVSANVVNISFDNSNKEFYFNNPDSIVAASLKRNRKIVPWLGVEIVPGEIEWYTLGTFWSYKWDVPVESLVAKVVGFDTIGLLDKTSFSAHTMQINRSIGQLIEYILDDAKKQLDFISYKIDSALYDVIIPYAWFDNSSHTAALRKLSSCYPMHIYCDREGNICAAPQKLHLDYYIDDWSDDTNVISKSYSSLYTTLPNIVNVEVKRPVAVAEQQLANDTLMFSVAAIPTRTLNFSSPYISDIEVTIDCDNTVSYSYATYSWGIVIDFVGTGSVRSITCVGTALDISNSAAIVNRDEESILANGAINRDIKSDFIQTANHASILIERIVALSEYDKYDAEVEYRGDIALSINDPIRLIGGIAPDNRYNIKRHELFWNGALSGSAHLNT